MTTPLIEAIARAIYVRAFQNCCNGASPGLGDESWRSYESEAQAALTAITEAGYVVAPRIATEEMLEVGAHCASSVPIPYTAEHIYRAMINVAQAPHIMPPPMRDAGPLESEEGE